MILETKRLVLREILPSDEESMFELDSDPLVHKYLGKNPIKNIEDIRKVITQIRNDYATKGIGRWAVIEKSSGNFMGWSGLKLNSEPLNNKTNFYDIGYRLIPRYWGKGYAFESATTALNYGFQSMELKEIFGAALIDNLASNHLLLKLGLSFIENFEFEGDIACWYAMRNPGM